MCCGVWGVWRLPVQRAAGAGCSTLGSAGTAPARSLSLSWDAQTQKEQDERKNFHILEGTTPSGSFWQSWRCVQEQSCLLCRCTTAGMTRESWGAWPKVPAEKPDALVLPG